MALVDQAQGSGSITGEHTFAQDGLYTVTVCVSDDDGGIACGSFEVLYAEPVLDLSLEKSADRKRLRPGAPLTYTLVVTNNGSLPLHNIEILDQIPEQLSFDSAPGSCAE